MGGAAHPQINAMSLVRAFDLGMDALEAVTAPRWLTGGMDPVGPDPFIVAESGTARVWAAFEEAGFRVDEVPSPTEEVGHAQLLIASPEGRFEAAADPRSDGGAAAR
jgi:gamma-glutamyltranspeptidase/glutathione hydrolase